MLTDKEIKILNKFKKAKHPSPLDMVIINKLAREGLLRVRVYRVVITKKGKQTLYKENIIRLPIVKQIYKQIRGFKNG